MNVESQDGTSDVSQKFIFHYSHLRKIFSEEPLNCLAIFYHKKYLSFG